MGFSYNVNIINGVKVKSMPHERMTIFFRHSHLKEGVVYYCSPDKNNETTPYCGECGKSNFDTTYHNPNWIYCENPKDTKFIAETKIVFDEHSSEMVFKDWKVATGHEAFEAGESPIFVGKRLLPGWFEPRCDRYEELDFQEVDYERLTRELEEAGYEVLGSGIFILTEVL